MNRATIINSLIALTIVGLVAAVFVLENRDSTPPTTTTTSTTIPATTTTTSTTTTTTTSTTTTSTVPPTTVEPIARPFWAVIVVNGTSAGERLEPMVQQLEEVGYANVRGLVGAVKTTDTVIYYVENALNGADRLRADLGLPDIELLPLEDAPPVAGRNDAQLILYLGGA